MKWHANSMKSIEHHEVVCVRLHQCTKYPSLGKHDESDLKWNRLVGCIVSVWTGLNTSTQYVGTNACNM